jgi:ABC-type multidrug transport system ATPase subunit
MSPAPVPVTLLAGFLGAGKTTLSSAEASLRAGAANYLVRREIRLERANFSARCGEVPEEGSTPPDANGKTTLLNRLLSAPGGAAVSNFTAYEEPWCSS